MTKPISSYSLQLSGKAELPEGIEIGSNYHVATEGSITGSSDSDNEDGTLSRVFKFKPVKIDILTPMGKTLKLKDARSKSQILRARFWSIWKEHNIEMSFESWYDKLMDNMREGAVEISEMYGPQIWLPTNKSNHI